jgi:DNA polymerase-3 subunit alpha
MESIPEYIARKHDPKLIRYLDPRMEEILKRSYGVITYQDDVLLIAIKLAGYSWLEADKLRKAMGKKIPAEMEAQRKKLIEGLVANGMTEEKAKKLWALIEPFAAYGFNLAHAASYGRVAYQTAYMKANHPVEYMAAVLTADSGDVDKVAEAVTESKRMGVRILPPDVNESFSDFTVVSVVGGAKNDRIRFGLYTIKNLGRDIADAIIEERKGKGTFISFSNFLTRIQHKNLNKKSLESLIKAGAFDTLGERGELLANMEAALEFNREIKNEDKNQQSLFGLMGETASTVSEFRITPAEPAPVSDRLAWERELLGLYLSGHPLEAYRKKFADNKNNISSVKHLRDDTEAVIAGVVEGIKSVFTKKGDNMTFARIVDFDDAIEVVFFPRAAFEYRELLALNRCIAVRGRVSHRNGEPSIVADKIKDLALD